MLTVSANWSAAAKLARNTPIFHVQITDGTNTWDAVTGDRPRYTYPNSVAEVSTISSRINPFTREPTIGDMEITFLRDGFFKSIAASNELKGQKVTVKFGFAEMTAVADFADFFVGVIDDFLPSYESYVLRASDAYAFMRDAQIQGQYPNAHPLEQIERLATDVGLVSALIDTTSLDPATYTSSISHYVVHRGQKKRENGSYPIEIDQEESALENIADLASLVDGSLVPNEQGKLRFVKYDKTASADRHFTANDYTDFRVIDTYGDLVNRVRFLHRWGWPRHSDLERNETGSQSTYAFPGGSTRIVEHEHSTRWVEGIAGLRSRYAATGAQIDWSGTPTYPFTFEIEGFRLGGISGTNVPSGWPTTAQSADVQVTSARPAYLMIENTVDGINKEIIKVTTITLDTSRAAILEGYNDFMPIRASCVINSASDRAQFGTTAQNYTHGVAGQNALYLVTDLTIPVAWTAEKLRRFAFGGGVIEFKTSILNYDLQIGDTISLDESDVYLRNGVSSLDSTTTWEIVGKQVILGDVPQIVWTCAWSNESGPPTPALSLTHRIPVSVNDSALRGQIRGSGGWDPSVLSGLIASAGSGLSADLTAGDAGTADFTARVDEDISITMPASSTSYIVADTMFGGLILDFGTPDAQSIGETPIAEITTDGSSVTGVVDLRDTETRVQAGTVSSTSGTSSTGVIIGGQVTNPLLQD